MTAALTLQAARAQVGGKLVLDGVDLTVAPGELVGVLGPNGAGKTSLIRAALGLLRLSGGRALLADRPVAGLSEAARASLAAYLPQERRVAWNLPVWRVAALGAVLRPPAIAEALARAALERVGLAALAERGVLDMSGGERARVLLARLLVGEAPLLVADEPAAGLDPEAQLMIMALFRREADEGRAVMTTLHDLTLAARYCDRVVVLARGRVVADGPPREALGARVLAEVFGLVGGVVDTQAGPAVLASRLATSD
jgi:iron complex transport system ATP-binding protein